MHTNDAFVICGKPVLGRAASDPIEVSGPPKGWFETNEIPNRRLQLHRQPRTSKAPS